jgi:hypothetical protein
MRKRSQSRGRIIRAVLHDVSSSVPNVGVSSWSFVACINRASPAERSCDVEVRESSCIEIQTQEETTAEQLAACAWQIARVRRLTNPLFAAQEKEASARRKKKVENVRVC